MVLVVLAFAGGLFYGKYQTLQQTLNNGGATVSNQAANNPGNNNPSQANNPAQPADVKVDPVTDQDHVRGNKQARIQLIEYSDLECPFCKRFHATAQQLVDDYNGQVAWVYRHFPIPQLHQKAQKESEAAECAAKLGGEDAFWNFVDKVFEITPSNDGLGGSDVTAALVDIASQIGLNANQFKSCLTSGEMASRVQRDIQSGQKAGVRGTPSNFIFDTKTNKTIAIPGAAPIVNFKQAIDQLLAE